LVRWLRRQWLPLATVAISAAVLYLVFWVVIPSGWLTLAPGPTPDVSSLVRPDEGAAGLDPNRGQGRFLLTTVQAWPATPIELWKAAFWDGVELHPRRYLVPVGMADKTYTDWSSAAMAESQMTAAWQAWTFLGHGVTLAAEGGEIFWVSARGPAVGQVRAGDLIVSWTLGQRSARFVTADEFKREISEAYAGLSGVGGAGAGAGGAAVPAGPANLILGLTRDGAPLTVTVRVDGVGLASWPFLGLALGARGLRSEPPIPVVFPPADIGGPSGGLMLALQIVDDFTPGDLTGGQVVAGSGTIGPGGRVGAVGGVTMKVLGAARAGATVFLVPNEDYDSARSAISDLGLAVRLIPVSDVGDACESLGAGSLTAGKSPDYNRADLRPPAAEQATWAAVGR